MSRSAVGPAMCPSVTLPNKLAAGLGPATLRTLPAALFVPQAVPQLDDLEDASDSWPRFPITSNADFGLFGFADPWGSGLADRVKSGLESGSDSDGYLDAFGSPTDV